MAEEEWFSENARRASLSTIINILTCDQSGRVQRHCFQQSLAHTVVGRRRRDDADERNGAGEGVICLQTFQGRARVSGKSRKWERWN